MPRARKVRLDQLLFEQGLFESRHKAAASIMAGEVKVGGVVVDKPGKKVSEDAEVEVVPRRPKYVSRGGEKLEGALSRLGVLVEGKVVVDIGAGTGGFTDCLLNFGARKVYAIDVGHGQLHHSLRENPKVVCLEGVNVRYAEPNLLPERGHLSTVDLSFISLLVALSGILNLLGPRAEVLALVKPQFEAGPKEVGKGGVVRDFGVHEKVLVEVALGFEREGLKVLGLFPSPLLGTKGNVEYFLYATLDQGRAPNPLPLKELANLAVREAMERFGRKKEEMNP